MQLTLINKKPETSDVVSYQFSTEQPITWQPGQFIEYALSHAAADDRGESRYFTISSAPHEGYVQITTRLATEHGSSFKSALDHLEVGGHIEASEPMGEFVIDNPQQSYVFVAGGIGITPFRSILLDLVQRREPLNVVLLYANRNQEFVFKSELDELTSQNPDFSIKYIEAPQQIELTDLQAAIQQFPVTPYLYISGPKPMVGSFKKMLIEDGFDKEFIRTDYFPGYND